jgi:hypothetical protein
MDSLGTLIILKTHLHLDSLHGSAAQGKQEYFVDSTTWLSLKRETSVCRCVFNFAKRRWEQARVNRSNHSLIVGGGRASCRRGDDGWGSTRRYLGVQCTVVRWRRASALAGAKGATAYGPGPGGAPIFFLHVQNGEAHWIGSPVPPWLSALLILILSVSAQDLFESGAHVVFQFLFYRINNTSYILL